MNEQCLKEIREREQAATPGPWSPYRTNLSNLPKDRQFVGVGTKIYSICKITGSEGNELEAMPDAEFIAAARQDIPWLLEQVEAVTALVAALTEIRDLARTGLPPMVIPADYWPQHKLNRIAGMASAALAPFVEGE